jgi:hypothetical protein
MVKSLLIGMNILGLIFLGYIQSSELKITQEIPTNLQAGEEALITVEIDKSDVSGFAKYQLIVSEGLQIEVVESAGASFTFNDQKAKFIWMALPAAKTFSLKYRIIAEADAEGLLLVKSRFSYIYHNERKNFILDEHTIAIGGATDDAIVQEEDSAPLNLNAEALAQRVMTSVGINQWETEIVISQSNLEGFSKIEETIPQGYTALNLNSNGAVFSLNDLTIKYIWTDIPQTRNVRVKYKLLPVVAMDGNQPEIFGTFSYLRDEETMSMPIIDSEMDEVIVEEVIEAPDEMEVEIVDTTVTLVTEPEPIAEAKPELEVIPETVAIVAAPPKPQPKQKTETKPTPAPKVESVVAEAKPKNSVDGNIVDVPLPEVGVYYRVQIAAGKNNVKQDTFAKMYNFHEVIKLENINGWFKYTTGHHQVYKSARDDRTRITAKYTKFKGPFVTAYNDGERITVQEALMITSQKWYP